MISVQVSLLLLLLLLMVKVVEVVMVVGSRRASRRRFGRRTIGPVGADVHASADHSSVEHPFVVRVSVESA